MPRGGPARNKFTDGRCREAKLRRGPVRAYSAAIKIVQGIDGRSKYGQVLITTRRALAAHLGGEDRLTAPQRALVERCAMLQLRLTVLDQRIVENTFTEYDAKTYLAFSNSLTRTLKAIGLDAASAPAPSLSDVLSDIAQRRHSEPDGDDEAA